MNPLILRASQGSLSAEMLPDIDHGFNTSTYSGKFEKHWNARKSDSISAFIWALSKSFGDTMLACAVFEFLNDTSRILHPFLLQQLLLYANSYWDGDGSSHNDNHPKSIGFYIALAMFVTAIVRTILSSQCREYGLRSACGVRSSLTNAIYRKSLVLASQERESRSTGEIVNMMAVDVSTIANMCYTVTSLWEIPFEFFIYLWSLSKLLGVSSWSVLAVLCVFLPLNWLFTRMIKKMRKQQMKYKDQRTRLTTEIITNVKSLKLYNWEDALLARLDYVRNTLQLQNLKQLMYMGCGLVFIWSIVPYAFSCLTFALYVKLENIPLTSDIVFPAMTLFNMVTGPISELPRMLTQFIDCGVSLARIRDFLCCKELQPNAVNRLPTASNRGDASVVVENASFGWSEKEGDDSTVLKNINFVAHRGELSCILGKVGTGKSSFVEALLGSLHKFGGSVTVMGSIAYVSQDPWLMNATVRENVIFGNKYDPVFYKKTIEACALVQDLEILPDGDNTEIGERGVSLSGGQKARLSLARAVYARSDVYLLDDPLSAVDEHVGRHIIRHVLSSRGLLASRTRVLCTNAINVLSHSDRISLLKDKTIVESGTYDQVRSGEGHLRDLIRDFGRQHNEQLHQSQGANDEPSLEMSESESEGSDTLANSVDIESPNNLATGDNSEDSGNDGNGSSSDQHKPLLQPLPPQIKNQKSAKIKETSAKGRVKWHVYIRYAAACGKFALALSLLIISSHAVLSLSTNFWLKYWVESNAKHGYNADAWFWIGGYFLLGFLESLLIVLRKIATRVFCGLSASRILHDSMARSVLASPMSFFETTPVGRIINRFSSDINELDEGLPAACIDIVKTVVRLTLSLAVVVISAPAILFFIIPLSVLYSYYQRYYQSASREIKRLYSMSRSPIFSHFQESLNGVSTIRAFGQSERFETVNEASININIRAIFLFRSMNRWLSFRLQTVGAAIVLTTACTIVVGAANKKFSPGLIGIMMTYTLEVTDHLNHIVRAIVNLETSIVGVERVLDYCDLQGEASSIVESRRPPAYWPHDGKIVFDNYSTKYRKDFEPVLRNVSFQIEPREKVAIIGRTGAGKTSTVMALFRIIEPTEGTIRVDGLDITQMGLYDLRSHLSIIPQDSQVLEGTIRQNLDPFNNYTDTDLWRVLGLAHLHDFVSDQLGGLDATVSEGGSNLSAGQRQLICLGRALLHESNVLVLDEATASVDVETDKLVQQTIRSHFKHKTIVTIAHRLNTIMDSDRIIVLDRGQVAEFDTPDNLLKNDKSLFYGLCKQGGWIE